MEAATHEERRRVSTLQFCLLKRTVVQEGFTKMNITFGSSLQFPFLFQIQPKTMKLLGIVGKACLINSALPDVTNCVSACRKVIAHGLHQFRGFCFYQSELAIVKFPRVLRMVAYQRFFRESFEERLIDEFDMIGVQLFPEIFYF